MSAAPGRIAGLVFALAHARLPGRQLSDRVLHSGGIPVEHDRPWRWTWSGRAGDSGAAHQASRRHCGLSTCDACKATRRNDPPDGGWDFKNNIRLAYLVVFIASFCGMSLELTASRVLAPILGVSLYTWTGIIGVMLAGTACGNYLGGVLADRGRRPAAATVRADHCDGRGLSGGPALSARSALTTSTRKERDQPRGGRADLGMLAGRPCTSAGPTRPVPGLGIFAAAWSASLVAYTVSPLGRGSSSYSRTSNDEFDNLNEQMRFDVGPCCFHRVGFILGRDRRIPARLRIRRKEREPAPKPGGPVGQSALFRRR